SRLNLSKNQSTYTGRTKPKIRDVTAHQKKIRSNIGRASTIMYNKKGDSFRPSPFPILLFFTFDFLHGISFNDVIHEDVVVIFDRDTAFVARFNFCYIIFKTFKLIDLAFVDHDTVSNTTDFVLSGDKTIGHITAGDGTNFGDFKDFPHLDIPSDYFFKSRLQHAFDGVFDLVDRVIDDGIMPDFDLFLFCDLLGIAGRPDLESKDDRV